MAQCEYTEEQILAEIARPKTRGRPRKYVTEEEREAAHYEQILKSQKRARIIARGGEVPPELMPSRVAKYETEEERRRGLRNSYARYYNTHIELQRLMTAVKRYTAEHAE